MRPTHSEPSVHPIFAPLLSGFAPHVPDLDALGPRYCACGAPTGSPALDTCEAHDPATPAELDGSERARQAIGALNLLATGEHARAVAELYADGRGEPPRA